MLNCSIDKEVLDFFIKKHEKKFDISKIATGIWYLDANSLDLVINIYKKEYLD